MPLFQNIFNTTSIQLYKVFHLSVVTFSYALLEVKARKYSSLVLPENYQETTYVHILPGVGS